jgi:hypothetical protein
MAAGGGIFMVFGFVLSLFITKETVVIPLGVALLSVLFFVAKIPVLKGLNIFNFMVGAGYLSNNDFLFDKAINVLGIAIIGVVIFLVAINLGRILKQMDF